MFLLPKIICRFNAIPNQGCNVIILKTKLTDDQVRSKIQNVGSGTVFLNMTPFAQEIRPASNKWDFKKLKSHSDTKETVNGLNSQPIQ